MEDLFYSFDPRTNTTRAPMPTAFEHLLGFVVKDERFITIHNQEQLININEQLEQTTNLIVSNIISRVIAQLIGQTDYGFSTIRATPAGALYVIQAGDLSATKIFASAAIDHGASGANVIITGSAGTKIKVVFIMFTVFAEVDVTFMSNSTPLSGEMDFGGTDEPRGMVAPMGIGPLVCETAEDFVIDLSGAIHIDGYCTYYKE